LFIAKVVIRKKNYNILSSVIWLVVFTILALIKS
jgi:uncharacterized protein HemY